MNDRIKAYFAGEWRILRIRRETLPALEGVLGDSAYATFRRIVGGVWTVSELRAVLEFAMLSDGNAARMVLASQMGMTINPSVFGGGTVSETLGTRPVAPYALLAARLLEAALFDIPDDRSTFDEREENGEEAVT